MSSGSGSRNPSSASHHGEDEYSKRRKSFYPSSTRRDFSSNSLSSSASHPSAPALSSSYTKPSLRAENSPGDYVSRNPRYRDAPAAPNPNSYASAKPSNFKDSRYPSYGKPYSYSPGYNQERPNGAYGSFSSAKRTETDSYNNFIHRDITSRDVVNGSSQRDGPAYSRSSWRSERPKLNSSVSSATKPFPSSRFNPNNIPVSSRAGGSNSLSSSGFSNTKRERYESYDDKSTRWKPHGTKKYDRIGGAGSFGRINNKERIRSSGLTNSVGSAKRNDSYLPSKGPQPSRYTDRYSRDQDDDDEYDESRRDLETAKSAKYGESYTENPESKTSTPELSPLMDVSQDINDGEDEEEEEDEVDEEEVEEDEDDDDEDIAEESSDMYQTRNTPKESEEADVKPNNPNLQTSNVFSPKSKANEVAKPVSSLLPANDFNSSELGTITYPDGCTFPQSEIEYKLDQLKHELQTLGPSKYSPSVGILNSDDFILELPSTSLNLLQFKANFSAHIQLIKARNLSLRKKKIQLWKSYDSYLTENEKRDANMKEQLEFLHNTDEETKRELESIDIRAKPSESVPDSPAIEAPATSGRRGRRHGDSVTTEAEFQEILKSLKNEDNEDPLIKAKQVSAEIPDLILDPLEREAFKFMDSNNLVQDKHVWEERLKTDFLTNFTEKEHDLYCEAFCRAPKRFGEIARLMGGLRSLHECVLHYYITKKNVNYKFMVSQYKKKASKKNARRKKKTKEDQLNDAHDSSMKGLGISEVVPEKPSTGELLAEEPLSINPKRSLETSNSGSYEAQGVRENGDSEGEPAKKRGRFDESADITVVENSIDHKPSSPVTEDLPTHTSGEVNILNSANLGSVDNGQGESLVKAENNGAEGHIDEAKVSNGMPAEQTSINFVKQNQEGAPDRSFTEDTARSTEHDSTAIAPDNQESEIGEKRKQISSYWSITDVNAFPEYLAQYGSKWTLIADKLATKSATMVRNYYQRNAEKFSWASVVAAADERLAQGNSTFPNSSQVMNIIVAKPQKVEEAQASSYARESDKIEQLSSSHPQVSGDKTVTVTPMRPLQNEVSIQPREESHKPSILSLLNAESISESTKSRSAPPPRNNNLAALLNAPSSPAVPPKEEEVQSHGKASSISSLLG